MATNIPVNDQKSLGRKLCRAMELGREGLDLTKQTVLIFETLKTGDGSNESHFQAAVDEGTFATLTAAKASWDEIQSMKFEYEKSEAAIRQSCAKHGR
jgi:hypothetical protein